jgi:hypothetical protein
MVNDHTEDKWNLPDALLSPEKIAEAAAAQKELALRVNSPYANKTSADIQRFNAGILITETEKLLEAIPLEDLHSTVREQYAEALAETGNFQKAAEATSIEAKSEFYDSLWDAVWKDDEERCDCAHQEFVNGQRKNNIFAESQVWSLKHNREMSVIKCGSCSHRNVRPLPDSIQKERALRRRVIELTSGRSKEEAKSILSQLHK